MTQITYHRQGKEYFIKTEQVIFFEASDDTTYAHTRSHIYRVKPRLYVLETLLPPNFQRASKSALANIDEVIALSQTVGTTGTAQFRHTQKRLHVSRKYIKTLRSALRQRSTKP